MSNFALLVRVELWLASRRSDSRDDAPMTTLPQLKQLVGCCSWPGMVLDKYFQVLEYNLGNEDFQMVYPLCMSLAFNICFMNIDTLTYMIAYCICKLIWILGDASHLLNKPFLKGSTNKLPSKPYTNHQEFQIHDNWTNVVLWYIALFYIPPSIKITIGFFCFTMIFLKILGRQVCGLFSESLWVVGTVIHSSNRGLNKTTIDSGISLLGTSLQPGQLHKPMWILLQHKAKGLHEPSSVKDLNSVWIIFYSESHIEQSTQLGKQYSFSCILGDSEDQINSDSLTSYIVYFIN